MPQYAEVLGTFMGAIRPGMVRVEATTTVGDVALVAFVSDSEERFVVVAVNNAPLAQEIVLPNGVSAMEGAKSVAAISGTIPAHGVASAPHHGSS